jgi:hypothetical protein
MTRDEKLDFLRNLPSETISPSVMALVDGGDPYTFNLMAKEGKLDIPHYWRGRNLRIWKGPVIKMIEGETSVQAGEN